VYSSSDIELSGAAILVVAEHLKRNWRLFKWIHHHNFRGRSGADAEQNLITLCTACHACVQVYMGVTALACELL